jgi:RNA-binding protein YlmH
MIDDSAKLKKRLAELYERALDTYCYTYTSFLGLAEQSALSELQREYSGMKYSAFRGVEGAERVIIRFGDCEEIGYEEPYPIAVLKISPKSKKFADALSHRDFLGALMNLGIERECLGDIAIVDNEAYLFCLESIADYISGSLTRIKHTEITVMTVDTLPDAPLYKTERRTVQISSERLDAIIARVFSLSREDAQRLFAKGLVFLSGKEITSPSRAPLKNEVVSVRGHGRFIYLGEKSLSKKGKINAEVEIYV